MLYLDIVYYASNFLNERIINLPHLVILNVYVQIEIFLIPIKTGRQDGDVTTPVTIIFTMVKSKIALRICCISLLTSVRMLDSNTSHPKFSVREFTAASFDDRIK